MVNQQKGVQQDTAYSAVGHLRDFHINRLRTLKRCAFWPKESLYFPCQKHLGIKLHVRLKTGMIPRKRPTHTLRFRGNVTRCNGYVYVVGYVNAHQRSMPNT